MIRCVRALFVQIFTVVNFLHHQLDVENKDIVDKIVAQIIEKRFGTIAYVVF